MNIRNLYERDFQEFKRIIKKFYNYAKNDIPEDNAIKLLFDKAISKDDFIFIGAFDNDKIAGILSLAFAESSYKVMPFGWCDDLYVEEDYRNKGIGKQLFLKAKEIAGERGCSCILAGVGQDEREANLFYKSIGFTDLKCNLLSLPI
jgi:GNAT superfamily N-acetyltransferase